MKNIEDLTNDYNTSIHENRFVVGNVIQRLTKTLLDHALSTSNMKCKFKDDGQNGIEICNEKESAIIKVQYTGEVSRITLKNKLSDNLSNWNWACLIIIGGKGMFYSDHSLVSSDYIKEESGALILTKKGVEDLIQKEEWKINMDIPQKLKRTNGGKVTSELLTKNLLCGNKKFKEI